MGHSKWTAVAVGSALLALGISRAAAQPGAIDQPQTVTLRIDNIAAVPLGRVRLAEERATNVFRAIGVHVIWIGGALETRERTAPAYTVVIANGEESTIPDSSGVAPLGFAVLPARRAYVFYNRVEATRAFSSARNIGLVLGDVIAHELGHLMLGEPGHSPKGIMRLEAYLTRWSNETFTKAQGRKIRARIEEERR